MKDNNSSFKTRFVLGVVGMVVFGILTLLFIPITLIIATMSAIPIIVFILLFALSAFVMNSGNIRKRIIDRLSRYMAELSAKNNVLLIEDMASLTGILPMQIKRDVRLLKQWDLSFDLYMDKGETTLIRGMSAYNQYLEADRQRLAREAEEHERQSRLNDPKTADIEAFRSEGDAILGKMHAANLLLPGEEISKSLTELEKTTKRIFEHVESHPEKLPETRKLMSYHLPTTMKLIEKYCQYDSMDYQPENVTAAKADIEKALSAANEAFGNFLEQLYHEETLDITTDAEVLTKMFEKDGLTGSKFEIKGEKNE